MKGWVLLEIPGKKLFSCFSSFWRALHSLEDESPFPTSSQPSVYPAYLQVPILLSCLTPGRILWLQQTQIIQRVSLTTKSEFNHIWKFLFPFEVTHRFQGLGWEAGASFSLPQSAKSLKPPTLSIKAFNWLKSPYPEASWETTKHHVRVACSCVTTPRLRAAEKRDHKATINVSNSGQIIPVFLCFNSKKSLYVCWCFLRN